MPIIYLITGILTDLVWTIYIQSVSKKQKLKSANLSVLIGLISWFVWEGTRDNFNNAIFWLVGLWIGTYYANTIEDSVKKIIKQRQTLV